MDSARRTVTPEGSTLGFAGGRETCQEGGDDPVHGVRLGDHLPGSGAGDNIGDKRIDAPEGARLIPLTRGLFAIVDEADHGWLSQWKWSAQFGTSGVIYARRYIRTPGCPRVVLMHREILGAKPHETIDHGNGNGLDNRRRNLRPCTKSQNARNGRPHRDSSFLKGVSFDPRKAKPFYARIFVDGVRKSLGYYTTEVEAGLSYDRAATRFFGPFARLNFVDGINVSHATQDDCGSDEWRQASGGAKPQ